MKFNPRKVPHKKDPLYTLYNEYLQIPSKKKAVFRNNSTSLPMKLFEYEKILARENELKQKLKEWIK